MEELVQIGGEKPLIADTGKPGVFIKTFGCQMNVYDSDKLETILASGYSPVENPEDAELILVNTCSVREKAEIKLYSLLGEFTPLKKKNPNLLIGVGGCVAQQEGEAIIKRSKNVDFVFGTHNLSLVPSLIRQRRKLNKPQVAINYRDEWEDLPLGFHGEGRVSVFVSISRGCNKNCTYCIVPTTRGVEVSRSLREIEKEIRIAAQRGAKEVVLLGQTVNSWGLDLEPRRKFVNLLEAVEKIEGIERIRFTSPHPQEVRDDFIEFATSKPKVCRHIHMPLQSGSDRILKLMRRNYRRKRYLSIIEALKERVPDISITTDIIVGFPGETEEDFQETLDVMEQVKFDNSYSFMFSPRPGTKAAEMEDDVPHEEKLRRLQLLQAKQNEIAKTRLEAWVGKTVEVLIDGPSKHDKKKMQGRTSQNIMVNLSHQQEGLSPGDMILAEVESAAKFTLKGRYLADSEPGVL